MVNYSIIIPHYNIPSLLERCVSSIPLREDIQVIIVDDCSPDQKNFREAISRIEKTHKIEVYSTPEGGSAGRARNVGLEHTLGKWIIFADADDFFADTFEDIIDKHVDSQADVVYFNYRSVMSDNPSIPSERKEKRDYFAEYSDTGDDSYFRYEFHVPWAKMIKRRLVESHHIRFDEVQYANDAMFAALVGCYAQTTDCDERYGYVLTERKNALCSNMFNKPGEALIRTKVLLRVNNVLKVLGHPCNDSYEAFIRNLIWAKDYRGLHEIYSESEKYGLSRHQIRKIVLQTGIRYTPLAMWLKFFG